MTGVNVKQQLINFLPITKNTKRIIEVQELAKIVYEMAAVFVLCSKSM